MSAPQNLRYGNAERTVVEAEMDGQRWVLPADDPRIAGRPITAFTPRTAEVAAPSRADLLALKARIDAALAALPLSNG